MHTAVELSSPSFGIRVGGRPGTLSDVLPEFGEQDRVGVVVRHPCGAVGASALILAAVTAFYDVQRSRSEEFFIYPDYFLFHVGAPLGDHGMLDIWPSHKEVVVADDPEELLRAINDRGITRLLVEDRPAFDSESAFERESLASARNRIVSALAYSPTGRVADADVLAAGNAVTESYVAAVLERSTEVAPELREEVALGRRALVEDGVPVESYRRVTLDDALVRL
ncbi:MAG: hypothetical protein JO181_03735 [Solirubrobacterales bacterium]|nr:hypothetical protein [Solirubrobacterales bacterium]MBV9796924.1 hypothetical protein [Solirubrobacterales bacterium]